MMIKILKKLFPKMTLKLRAFRIMILDMGSFIHSTGWLNSIKEQKPIDDNGESIPWMNYSFIYFLKPRIKVDFKLFEFGSGYSTTYFSKLFNKVISVEYDKGWFELVNSNKPQNVDLIYQEKDTDGNYCRSVINFNKHFDVILVDGRDRVNCIKQSINALTEFGVIILDDSNREKYQPAFEFMAKEGFKEITISGPKPISNEFVSSTIFYRKHNCLGI